MYKRIRDLREDNDFSQNDIAKKLNMSQAQYQRYDSNTVLPPLYVLIELAKIYNVSVDYILGLTDIKRTPQTQDYSQETRKLIKNFNRLNDDNKDIILGQIALLIKEQQSTVKEKKDII